MNRVTEVIHQWLNEQNKFIIYVRRSQFSSWSSAMNSLVTIFTQSLICIQANCQSDYFSYNTHPICNIKNAIVCWLVKIAIFRIILNITIMDIMVFRFRFSCLMPWINTETTAQKWTFPLWISSVNVTKSAVFWSHLLKKSLIEKFCAMHFLCNAWYRFWFMCVRKALQ